MVHLGIFLMNIKFHICITLCDNNIKNNLKITLLSTVLCEITLFSPMKLAIFFSSLSRPVILILSLSKCARYSLPPNAWIFSSKIRYNFNLISPHRPKADMDSTSTNKLTSTGIIKAHLITILYYVINAYTFLLMDVRPTCISSYLLLLTR